MITRPLLRTCGVIGAVLLLAPFARSADTRLADSAERRQWATVRQLLEQGHDANTAQPDGMTPLLWAVWHDHAESTRLLLQHNADVQQANRYGVSPLSLACLRGNEELVELLLQGGADANRAIPVVGETPLMTAARCGKPGAVKALLDHGADVNAHESKGQTALMWAAAEGHTAVVQMLLDAGSDIRASLRSGFTPLFFAVREGKTDVVELLLNAGADVNETMQPEYSGGRIARSGTSPLLLAVENGHFQLAARLLELGADANDQRSGYTALHALTWVRKPNLGDGVDGDPPPIGSGNMTSLQLVRKLVQHGADVHARLARGAKGRGRLTESGATPFFFAADTADVAYMKLLLELGADPLQTNDDHCPPLLAAAGLGTRAPGEEAGTEQESLEAVQLLLELGADINAVDDNGETAMHGAAYASFPRMVDFLSANGADIRVWNQKNRYGWTPLLIAEGHRPGNFKPSEETIAAIHRAMLAAGVTPPKERTPRKTRDYREDNP